MAQHDYDINSSDSVSGLQFRQDLNSCLTAIKSTNSGASEPPSPIAGMRWLDNSVTPPMLKERNQTNDGWIKVPIEDLMATTIASSTTTNIGIYGNGKVVHITGGTTITSFGASNTGTIRYVVFDNVLTITHNSASLILSGGANITTQSGDCAVFLCENGASGNWRLLHYLPSALSVSELRCLDGVTSNIQTQLTSLNNSIGTVSQNAINAQIASAQAQAARDQAVAVVIPTTASYLTSNIDWKMSMMSKEAFNAVAAERRANRAGSGAEEMGRGSATTILNVNDGIHTSTNAPNTFYLGKVGGTGTSKTDAYIASINGSIIACKYINTTSADATLLLPPSPTVLPYNATLTTEQIAMGVIKHADASNSGLIVNGKFTTDTSGWIAFGGTTLSAVSGGCVITSTGQSNCGASQSINNFIVGKKYIVEAVLRRGTSVGSVKIDVSGIGQTTVNSTTVPQRYTFEFIATAQSHTIQIYIVGATTAGETAIFDNVAVFPADAISSQDFVHIKQTDIDISVQDFVYPLGLPQYLGSAQSGMPAVTVGSFSGSGTYSLFGNFQASGALVGKGHIWSALTDAYKKVFVSNHENNCYLDGATVRQKHTFVKNFRLPSDSYTESTAFTYIGYTVDSIDKGMYNHADGSVAIPIALVHRRNQGMYHPTYNANGTKLASDGNFWYNTSISFTSIADCFDSSKLLTASGYIGTTSGRPDGLFYDQINEGDIIDLRMNSAKVEDYNRLIDREFNKLVAGTYRGSEGELNTEVKTQTTTGTVATVEVNDGTRYKSGDVIQIYDLTASAVKGRFIVKSISTNTLTVDTSFAKLANSYMISGARTTRTKSNTITITDLIGSPSNLPSIMKADGQSFNTLHTAEDGTSMLPTGALATFKLSRRANATPLQVLKSTDSGATWTALTVTTHYTFSTVINVITFVTAPATTDLIMVTYQTHTNMAVAGVNAEVLAIGDVLGTNHASYGQINQSLIGKIPTNATVPVSLKGFTIGNYRIDVGTLKFSTIATEFPLHGSITLGGGSAGSSAVKTFPYLTRSNGKARLQLVFKEMKHNGTTWGDDSKFSIVDNVSTTTDNNAQTVLIGQKYAELPYFIGASE